MNDLTAVADTGTVPELDLRDMAAPEPLLRALAAADALAPGASIRVLTPMLPLPLLDALTGRGLRYRAERLPGGGACVLIERRRNGAAGA